MFSKTCVQFQYMKKVTAIKKISLKKKDIKQKKEVTWLKSKKEIVTKRKEIFCTIPKYLDKSLKNYNINKDTIQIICFNGIMTLLQYYFKYQILLTYATSSSAVLKVIKKQVPNLS